MGSLAPDHYLGPQRIELSGTPREIGLQHGRLLAQKIHSQIQVYTSMFAQTSKLTWPMVLEIAKEHNDTILRLTPDIHAEIAGIAEGAGVDILDIVALNCRSEIALGCFSDGCTSVGWKVSEEEVFLAQNWDWTARVKENLVMVRIEQVGKPGIWMVTEAGIVGKIGFNSSSVGVCLNAIRAKPISTSALPIHIVLRLCLEAPAAASAIQTLNSLGGIAASAHILIADHTGPLGLELSPKGDVHLQPNGHGILCHTNHFLSNKYVTEPPWLSGSPIRLERANILTSELNQRRTRGEKITQEILRDKVFSDTFNKPQAICCQEDPSRPIETRSSTLFNIVMKFEVGKEPCAEVVWGRPGSGEEGPVLKMPW